MAAFCVGLLVQVALKIAHGLAPVVEVMGAVGFMAFVANGNAAVHRRRGGRRNRLAVAGYRHRPAAGLGVGRSAAQVVREASRAIVATG
jgi:hypothetical protein